ncbi:MAG: thioredoxin family protein [Sphingobacteriales bacterium]|nr:thioredoxin family protein [Sphingobacteriales bacterium]
MRVFKISLVVIILFSFGFKGDQYKQTKHVGKVIPEFSLLNTDNKFVGLSNFPNAKGFIIVFTCNHCPFAKLYPERLNALNLKYTKLDVPLLAINSMDTVVYVDESFGLMREKAIRENLNFPYLYDASQTVGKSFSADHTPHAFIIWKVNNQWVIKYSGAIDDNGEHPEIASSFIEPVLNELLANKEVSKSETASFGCRIYYRK